MHLSVTIRASTMHDKKDSVGKDAFLDIISVQGTKREKRS